MHAFAHPISGSASAEQVLVRLGARARDDGLPQPASVTGKWFDGNAVLAPSVDIQPAKASEAYAALDRLPTVQATPKLPDGFVGGGWVGYLGYAVTDPGGSARDRALAHAAWGWADHVLRRDPNGQWWFEGLGVDDHVAAELLAELRELVHEPGDGLLEASWTAGPVEWPDPARHQKAVRRCLDEIAAGEIYQANICSHFSLPFNGDPLELFARGSSRMNPARAAYVAGSWGAVASLSPELFLSRHGEVVHSSPIKGTLPRRGPADDGNARLLRESVKDVAENVMIVDMARNDLGRLANVGRVTTPRLLEVQAHPGVWHLVSDVRAEIDQRVPNSRLLEAAFPPASVTGAPKTRALDVIAELESEPRDVYCGAVGMASPVAGMELNVAIRTLEYHDGKLRFGVGGGITADSDPEREWQECLTKAAPLLSLLGVG